MSSIETNGLSGTLLVRGKLGRHRPHCCWIDADALHWRQLTKAPDASQHSLFLCDITSITPNSESYTFHVRVLCAKDFGFVHRTFIFAVPKSPASEVQESREVRLATWTCGLEAARSGVRVAASPRSPLADRSHRAEHLVNGTSTGFAVPFASGPALRSLPPRPRFSSIGGFEAGAPGAGAGATLLPLHSYLVAPVAAAAVAVEVAEVAAVAGGVDQREEEREVEEEEDDDDVEELELEQDEEDEEQEQALELELQGGVSVSTPIARAGSCPVSGWLLPWDDGARDDGSREQAGEADAVEGHEGEGEGEDEGDGTWLLSPLDLRRRHVTPSRLAGRTGLSLRLCEVQLCEAQLCEVQLCEVQLGEVQLGEAQPEEKRREAQLCGEAGRVLPLTGLRLHEAAATEAAMAQWLSGSEPASAVRHAVLCSEAASPSAWPSPSAWRPDAPAAPTAPAAPHARPPANPLAPTSHTATEAMGRAHRAIAAPPPHRTQPGRQPQQASRGRGRGRGGFGYVSSRGRGRGFVQNMMVERTLPKPPPRPTPTPVACPQPTHIVPSPRPQPSPACASKLPMEQRLASVAAPRPVSAGAEARVEVGGGAGGGAGGEEGALLFARLCALDPSAEAADYQLTAASEAWDLQGLRSDIELVEEAVDP